MVEYKPTKPESALAIVFTTISAWLLMAAGVCMYLGWLPSSPLGWIFLLALLLPSYLVARQALHVLPPSKRQ
jgi:hypothetical protein